MQRPFRQSPLPDPPPRWRAGEDATSPAKLMGDGSAGRGRPLPRSGGGSGRGLLFLALPALLALGAAPPLPLPAISAAEREQLARGEVIVRLEQVRPGSPREGTGLAVVDYPPERVFRAVSDFGHYHEFMPFLVRSDATPQPDGTAVVSQRLDLPAPMGDRSYKVRASARVDGQGARRIHEARWAYVPGSGNVDDHRGSFTLVEFAPGRTLAVCRLYTDPGGFVPDRSMDRATEKSLGWVFKALRLHARRSRYDG